VSQSLIRTPLTLAEPEPTTRRALIVTFGVVVGIALAVLWSAQLVDDQIGENVASNLLGHDARSSAVGSGVAGGVFAFVAGLAGTFTACNVAAFSAVGPMLGDADTVGARLRQALRRSGWLALGVVIVAGVYGAVGAAVGTGIPQFSSDTVGNHMPVRLVQSLIVFVVIGVIGRVLRLFRAQGAPRMAGLLGT